MAGSSPLNATAQQYAFNACGQRPIDLLINHWRSQRKVQRSDEIVQNDFFTLGLRV
jgi:hypothetical protein